MTTTRTRRTSARRMIGAGITATALLATACSAPGGQSADTETTADTPASTITAPVTAEEVAELGDITLSVWADQGEQSLMDILVPAYEDAYPNVTVDVQFKSYNDLVATVLNAMNSTDAPDVTQGNQGWATDGALVKSGLIRPLDDVAQAYGYADAVGAAASQLQWSEDGSVFGSGAIYGMSPDNQMVGVFYNKEKLAAANLEIPTSFAEFEAALAAVKQAGETPIMLGNSDKAGAMQAFSVIRERSRLPPTPLVGSPAPKAQTSTPMPTPRHWSSLRSGHKRVCSPRGTTGPAQMTRRLPSPAARARSSSAATGTPARSRTPIRSGSSQRRPAMSTRPHRLDHSVCRGTSPASQMPPSLPSPSSA